MLGIPEMLSRMAFLLKQADEHDWAAACDRISVEFRQRPNDDSRKAILRLYRGGMGSFNDIVLYKNGRLLAEETSEFKTLSSSLHAACIRELGRNSNSR